VPVAATPPAAVNDGRCPAPLTWRALWRDGQSKIDPVKNLLSLDDDGRLYWNGVPIDAPRLRQYLDATQTMNPTPLMVVEVDPKTPCDKISRLVVLVGSVADCTRDCTYREKAFDATKALPEPSPQASRVLAARHPSSPDDAGNGGSCGGGRTILTLDSEASWSPWLEVTPGCALWVVNAAGDPASAESAPHYVRECRWRQSAADDCETADAVRFARNPRAPSQGSAVELKLELDRF